ncbi:MAG: universal stress protein [Bacillota bacterium]|jgi:nucleotide-binding universal stress UspA family protein|nr:universal stress protein [Bacillota bacterium]
MFKKILVAMDGSDMSKKAFETALLMAEEHESMLSLINVGKSLAIPQGMVIDSIDEVYDSMRKEGEELLNKGKWLADSKGISAEIHYVEGDPAAQIIKLAKDGHFQLIVIGSRGLGPFKEMMLGSVSHRVSQLSHCPVLIVK